MILKYLSATSLPKLRQVFLWTVLKTKNSVKIKQY